MSYPTGFLPCGPKTRNIQLQHVSAVADASGGVVDTFTTYATVDGHLHELKGNLHFQDERILAKETHALYIKFRSDVLVQDRVYANGAYYKISRKVNPFNTNQILMLRLEVISQ